jgi:hypothetical protein
MNQFYAPASQTQSVYSSLPPIFTGAAPAQHAAEERDVDALYNNSLQCQRC